MLPMKFWTEYNYFLFTSHALDTAPVNIPFLHIIHSRCTISMLWNVCVLKIKISHSPNWCRVRKLSWFAQFTLLKRQSLFKTPCCLLLLHETTYQLPEYIFSKIENLIVPFWKMLSSNILFSSSTSCISSLSSSIVTSLNSDSSLNIYVCVYCNNRRYLMQHKGKEHKLILTVYKRI